MTRLWNIPRCATALLSMGLFGLCLSGAKAQIEQAQLPPGVDQIYALESTNTLLVLATSDGFDTVQELVKSLDGQLEIVRTEVARVDVSNSDLAKLGLPNLTSDLNAHDGETLVAAFSKGTLRASQGVAITTRSTTAVDVSLTKPYGSKNTPNTLLSMVPRVGKGSVVTLELSQPANATVSVHNGETTVLVLSRSNTSTSLLFLTPTILPSTWRP